MDTFLEGVARAYLCEEPQNLAHYCFVFPSKRSKTVWVDALTKMQRSKGATLVLNPATTTMADFIADFASGLPAQRMDLVLRLFTIYRQIMAEQCKVRPALQSELMDFDNFVFWADMILGDFNDVDMYMVPPDELFVNLRRLKEIATDPLTDDIADELRKYYAHVRPNPKAEQFWLHDIDRKNSHPSPSLASGRFMRLWIILDEVYHRFRHQLQADGLYYTGMAYREVAQRCLSDAPDALTRDDLPFRRYIFVGLTMLSRSEQTILATLRDMGTPDNPVADFYWDDASLAFSPKGGAPSYFMRENVKLFPSLYAEKYLQKPKSWPQINIIGISSQSGQPQAIGDILLKLYPRTDNALRGLEHTAVILPQESLVSHLLFSIPPHIKPLNITMGYKLRNTGVATLIDAIIKLQLRARRDARGEYTFFFQDVRRVLSHPLLQQHDSQEGTRILSAISQQHLFNVPQSVLLSTNPTAPNLNAVFTCVAAIGSVEGVFSYLRSLLHWLQELLQTPADTEITPDPDAVADTEEPSPLTDDIALVPANDDIDASLSLQWALVGAYLNAVDSLEGLMQKYLKGAVLNVDYSTIFSIIQKMTAGESVNFEGVPLIGLQIMGVLEARAIDFQHVIIPSMNERIFPRRHFSRSFIPPALRAAYRMSTVRHQESLYSYYFYRMIARAKSVWLLYDTCTQGAKSANPSRYINQLRYFFKPDKLCETTHAYQVSVPQPELIKIEKTPQILEQINRYFSSGPNAKALSASSIETFRNCSLQFYLTHIEHFQREDEMVDYMDSSTYGTVLHDTMQDIYDGIHKVGKNTITAAALDSYINEPEVKIAPLIRKNINIKYFHLKDPHDKTIPLIGEAALYAQNIMRAVVAFLQADKTLTPFEYLHSEYPDRKHPFLKFHLQRVASPDTVNPTNPTAPDKLQELDVNLSYRIDRIDRVKDTDGNMRLRVVDYKTGADEHKISKIDDLFIPPKSGYVAKAVRQAIIYCHAYAQEFATPDTPIQPILYKARSIVKEKVVEPIICKGQTVTDYRSVLEYQNHLLDLLQDLRNPDKPFQANETDEGCSFCQFQALCQRSPAKK